MNKLRINHNEKGFTLIELMIVIAIIGILAAIAIPNFISYRNKSFCSRAESDANSIAASIADYFAIPTNMTISQGSYIAAADSFIPPVNTYTITAGDPNVAITITVTDASLRCPDTYMTASPIVGGAGWTTLSNMYTKAISN